MKFCHQVNNIYETTANTPWKEDLAHTLFSDVVASQLEDFHASEGDDEAHEIAEELSNEVHPEGGDITEAITSLAEKEYINLKEYYDIPQIEKMDIALRKVLHVGLEDVYNQNVLWAHFIVLAFVGHGVSPFDDKGFQAWLQYKSGTTERDWQHHAHFESPFSGAAGFIDQVIEQRKSAEEEPEEEEVNSALDFNYIVNIGNEGYED